MGLGFAISSIYNISFVFHLPGHRHHRRTQSAPPTTVHKHVQSNYIDYSKATQIEDRKSKGFANLELQLPSSPFGRQNGASPVRKFLSFVREVAEKRTKSSEKSEENSEVDSQCENDEFLEVILDENDSPSENRTLHNGKSHSPSTYSLDDTIRRKSSSLEKVIGYTDHYLNIFFIQIVGLSFYHIDLNAGPAPGVSQDICRV